MMKTNWIKKALSVVLAGAMVICLSATAGAPTSVFAEESEGGGKYVSDIFIAYGKTEDKATKWLTDNGWEPVAGDFNAGKASYWDNSAGHRDNVAAVMGIHRTDKEDEAITDMAVMNMKGGYSEPDFKELLKTKKNEINEFVNDFMVVIDEYRANYNGEGSEFGKKRADFVYSMLETFYDGDPEGSDAVNDTGKTLGALLMEKTRQEGNEKGADLEQMLLEGSGPSMLAVETLLTLAADTGEDSWLQRASGLTGDKLSENLVKYVPAAAGRDIAPSEVPTYLNERYGDTAKTLASQWESINSQMVWFEEYSEEHDLWQHDDEADEDYIARLAAYLNELRKTEDEELIVEANQYERTAVIYNGLYDVPYEGEWGETMGDFFNPADAQYAYPKADAFLPMAAGLSDGQTAGLSFLSLQTLLLIGLNSQKAFEEISAQIQELYAGNVSLDIYLGVNRAAFRGGVAITSRALMEEHAGYGNAFDKLWDNTGIVASVTYGTAVLGAVMMVTGGIMWAKGFTYVTNSPMTEFGVDTVTFLRRSIQAAKDDIAFSGGQGFGVESTRTFLREAQEELKQYTVTTRAGYAGRVLVGIGGALLIGAAVVSAIQMAKYYDRDMLPIPRMIVDESDVVTYLTDDDGNPVLDENGEQKTNIDFNTYEFYEAVKCNRPEVGNVGGDWNDGVAEYKNHNCYDVADLNCDMGQEWVALYTVKSKNKGKPVLADSLKLQYGKKDMPEGCTQSLHRFTYTNTVDLGDTAWAYNNKKNGVYFFWDADENAFATDAASAFSGGQLALAGIGGLILGIAGATLVLNKKRREGEAEAA